MARKCASAAILETLRDPRVITMPLAAQAVWMRIITAMQVSQISVLKIGSEIMNPKGIALFVGVSESEIETNLETVLGRRLLIRDDEGAVTCPMLAASTARSEINRINGLKGGRPKKNHSPPGQGNMMLPIQGGKDESKITKMETENPDPAPNSATYLLKEVAESEKVSGVPETEFVRTGEAVLEVMGINRARSFMNYGLVRQWLADGADYDLILDVVSRRNKPGITTLKYFSSAIAEAIAARPAKKPEWQRSYDRAMANWECYGRGVEPMPDYRKFKEAAA